MTSALPELTTATPMLHAPTQPADSLATVMLATAAMVLPALISMSAQATLITVTQTRLAQTLKVASHAPVTQVTPVTESIALM